MIKLRFGIKRLLKQDTYKDQERNQIKFTKKQKNLKINFQIIKNGKVIIKNMKTQKLYYYDQLIDFNTQNFIFY